MKKVLCIFLTKALLLLLFIISGQYLHAQFVVTGKVTDSLNKPVVNCNVLLLSTKDSSLVKGSLSNEAGAFTLKEISSGNYLISYSSAGFETTYKPVEVNGPADAGTVVLSRAIQELKTVTVTTKKPLFEQKIDRMVVNVKNSITSTGGTVLDVLQKSPGVVVNRQGGTISMSGKDGVQVMINGRLSYMPADALLTMLDGMNANNVERIELITTPPSKYDAGGNAGYINIVLSQSPNEGFNGTYSVTAAAFHGSSPAANFDFNYRRKKANLYGGYAFSRRAQLQLFTNHRKVIYQGKTTETDVKSERDPSQTNNVLRLGYDYQLSKNTTVGILASGYNNLWQMDAVNRSLTAVNGLNDSTILIDNTEKNHWQHGMGNFNLQHNFNNGNLSFNADFLYYNNHNPTDYTDKYFDGSGNFLSTEQLQSSKKTVIHIFPLQFDLHKKLSNTAELETGVKSVFTKFTNNVLVAKLDQNIWIPDQEFTGNYLLKENLAAAYASATWNVTPSNTIKAGLRYEYTYSNLGSETKKDIVNRKYGYLFPTVYFSHKINDNNTINLSYNRRIKRPTFNDLAPFLIFVDPKTFLSGNAALQPALSDGVKIDYVLKRFIFSLAYTYESASIGNFQVEVNTATNKQYMTAQNLEFTKNASATFSIPFSPTRWWTSQVNLVAIWQQAKASHLKDPIDVSVFNYNISGFQSFSLPKNYSIEFSGFYQSKALFGVARTDGFGILNFGAQKKFSKANCSLRFGVDDIFSSLKFRFSTDVPEEQFYTSGTIQFRKRIFKLTFTQSFGNKILKNKRERQTASDEERQRVTQ